MNIRTLPFWEWRDYWNGEEGNREEGRPFQGWRGGGKAYREVA